LAEAKASVERLLDTIVCIEAFQAVPTFHHYIEGLAKDAYKRIKYLNLNANTYDPKLVAEWMIAHGLPVWFAAAKASPKDGPAEFKNESPQGDLNYFLRTIFTSLSHKEGGKLVNPPINNLKIPDDIANTLKIMRQQEENPRFAWFALRYYPGQTAAQKTANKALPIPPKPSAQHLVQAFSKDAVEPKDDLLAFLRQHFKTFSASNLARVSVDDFKNLRFEKPLEWVNCVALLIKMIFTSKAEQQSQASVLVKQALTDEKLIALVTALTHQERTGLIKQINTAQGADLAETKAVLQSILLNYDGEQTGAAQVTKAAAEKALDALLNHYHGFHNEVASRQVLMKDALFEDNQAAGNMLYKNLRGTGLENLVPCEKNSFASLYTYLENIKDHSGKYVSDLAAAKDLLWVMAYYSKATNSKGEVKKNHYQLMARAAYEKLFPGELSHATPFKPIPGTPVPPDMKIVDLAKLEHDYLHIDPRHQQADKYVVFGTSGHRGTSLDGTFTVEHVRAVCLAIVRHRRKQNIDGPLFLGFDSHALSRSAYETALGIFVENGVDVRIAENNELAATPVISHMILEYNANEGKQTGKKADGVIITPSHNPPQAAGMKYNPPNGGAAESAITKAIEDDANIIMKARLIVNDQNQVTGTREISTLHKFLGVFGAGYDYKFNNPSKDFNTAYDKATKVDFVESYVTNYLPTVANIKAIIKAGVRMGVAPMGGASLPIWQRIVQKIKDGDEQYKGLNLAIVNDWLDPEFKFMTFDHDGKIRMDPSSKDAMAWVLQDKAIFDKHGFDIIIAFDPDADRHALICPPREEGGDLELMNPNHTASVFLYYLLKNRPKWARVIAEGAMVGKTIVTTQLLNRIAESFGLEVYQPPVGFKFFNIGLLINKLLFAYEESAGGAMIGLDPENPVARTTDKCGPTFAFLAAEVMAAEGRHPNDIFWDVIQKKFGPLHHTRRDKVVGADAMGALDRLMANPDALLGEEIAGHKVVKVLIEAPVDLEMNQGSFGGIWIGFGDPKSDNPSKIVGWTCIRPSGTEYGLLKTYGEAKSMEQTLELIAGSREKLEAMAEPSSAPSTVPAKEEKAAPAKAATAPAAKWRLESLQMSLEALERPLGKDIATVHIATYSKAASPEAIFAGISGRPGRATVERRAGSDRGDLEFILQSLKGVLKNKPNGRHLVVADPVPLLNTGPYAAEPAVQVKNLANAVKQGQLVLRQLPENDRGLILVHRANATIVPGELKLNDLAMSTGLLTFRHNQEDTGTFALTTKTAQALVKNLLPLANKYPLNFAAHVLLPRTLKSSEWMKLFDDLNKYRHHGRVPDIEHRELIKTMFALENKDQGLVFDNAQDWKTIWQAANGNVVENVPMGNGQASFG
ncbi:MAG: hypothetical protein KJ811_04285, partial [Candidatus Margulisbacteria bacterium]|nr:hypothetical protein [Candidatus Margulisiibacteriota bacterium]